MYVGEMINVFIYAFLGPWLVNSGGIKTVYDLGLNMTLVLTFQVFDLMTKLHK